MTEQTGTTVANEPPAYGTLTPTDIAEIGLQAGRDAFATVRRYTLRAPNLHMRAGMEMGNEGTLTEIGQGVIEKTKGAAEEFAVNTRLDDGKLATVSKHHADSDAVLAMYDVVFDEDDPRGWTGGAADTARVELDGKWYTKRLGAACSGVEGMWDRFVSKAIAAAMAAVWVLDAEARYERDGTLPI